MESSVLSWLRSPMFRWIVAAAVPSAAFGILVQNTALDIRVEIPWAHLMLMTVVGLISIILSLLIMRVAARTEDTRILLLALAFYAMGIFLVVHALLTPETLVPFATTGTEVALLTGFLLCSALLAASGQRSSGQGPTAILRNSLWLFLGLTLVAVLIAVVGVFVPSLFMDVRASLLQADQYGDVNTAISGSAGLLTFVLLSIAIVPYYRDFRLTGLSFYNAMVSGLLLLQVASLAVTISLVWHVSWWEYHVLLLVGLGVILSGVLREAVSRSNLLEVLASLLVGDTVGKLERSYTQVLQALVDLVEARHPYTFGHSSRVARLAASIGEAIGLVPEQIRHPPDGPPA